MAVIEARPVKVLVVEDSEDDMQLVLRALRRFGFVPSHSRVQTAADFTAALAGGPWDAVISDYAMPGFTGIDALRIFRSSGFDTPFILVSGTIGEELAADAMKAGASDYVMKQNLARLAPALERELKEAEVRVAHSRVQRDLVESERRFSDLLANVQLVSVMLDGKARITYCNECLLRLTGWRLEEVIGRNWFELFVPADVADTKAIFATMLANLPQAWNRDNVIVARSGERRLIRWNNSVLRSADGEVIGTASIGEDITEQKTRDAQLQRFRAAMDVSGDAILLIDRESMRYIDVNQTLCDLIGRTREELVGMTPMDIFSADRETLERDYDALIEDNNSSASLVEGEYRHKDGTVIPVETRRRAMRIDNGWVIVGTARDITRRKAADAKIQRLSRMHAVLSGINTLIVRVTDRDELFREACRIAVDAGGFKMAWIGLADREAKMIVPIASAGAEPGFLKQMADRFSLRGDTPFGSTRTARAATEKTAIVCNDIRKAPGFLFRNERLERGIASMAVLPLMVAGEAAGVLSLHAGEIGFFDAEEMKLLTELAGDIAFAIDHIAKQERIDYLAYYDVLTGLANRTLFLERVAQYMRSAASGGHKLAVFFIDLERFKNINDSLGRAAGDALLRQVADWLTAGGGDPNLVARVGADHFAVVMPKVNQDGEVERFVKNRLDGFIEHPFRLNDAIFRIAIKVGVALYPDDASDADTLLRNAEVALKKAKARGERYVLYKEKMSAKGAGKLTLENKLRMALENEEFVLHYQPKVSLLSGRLTSAEALIRWNDPLTGLVPPGQFIPILEETGLIHDVGRWALRKALEDFLRWRAAGLPAVRIAVNVSPLQLRSREFIAEIQQVIGVDAHAAAGLELEITESLIMEDVKHSIASLQAIRDMKVTVAIDDFGTGFSSLSYLARLPVDTLKIDRSFVVDMTAGPNGLSLVSTIINLAHSLKLKVVAEGVETEEQSRLLRLLGCNEMQGFLFSRPVPAEEFEAKFLASSGPAS